MRDHRHLSERDVAVTLLPSASAAPPGSARSVRSTSGEAALTPLTPAAISSSLRPWRSPSATAALPECPHCRARFEEAAALAREFHTHIFPRTLPCIHERVAAASVPFWRRRLDLLRPWLTAPLATVTVAAILFAVWPRAERPFSVPAGDELATAVEPDASLVDEPPELRTKSTAPFSPRLLLRRGANVQRIDDGAIVHPGDALAFLVDPGPSRFALVLSIDGGRQISVYSPYAGATSAPVPASSLSTALQPSITLDATLGPERIWLLVSDAPLPVALFRPTLEHLAASGATAVERATIATLLGTLPADQRASIEAATWLVTKEP